MQKEIEIRFLEIDKEKTIARLKEIGAEDKGEDFLREIIFYDMDLERRKRDRTWVKLRNRHEKNTLTYKRQHSDAIDGVEEIETEVGDIDDMTAIIERMHWFASRRQEKWRHTFIFEGITFDIDTWPTVPAYIEIEADSEENVRKGAELLGLDWNNGTFEPVGDILIKNYNLNHRKLKFFTFDKIELLDEFK